MSEEEAWQFLRGWLTNKPKGAKLHIDFAENFQGDMRFKVAAFNPGSGYWESSEHATLAGPIVEVATKLKAHR